MVGETVAGLADEKECWKAGMTADKMVVVTAGKMESLLVV